MFTLGDHFFRREKMRRGRQNSKFAQNPRDSVGGLSSDGQPIFQSIFLETNFLHPRLIGNRIVGSDNFQKLSISGGVLLGRHQPVKGSVCPTESLQPQSNDHATILLRTTSSSRPCFWLLFVAPVSMYSNLTYRRNGQRTDEGTSPDPLESNCFALLNLLPRGNISDMDSARTTHDGTPTGRACVASRTYPTQSSAAASVSLASRLSLVGASTKV
jgi:hypothetical protein